MDQLHTTPAGTPPKKAKTYSLLTGLLLTLGILVVLNLVSSFFFARLDFSKGKIHTLSKTSKQLVRKLDDNVVIKAYMSRNPPPEYSILARYTKDLLGEYKLAGRGHFRFEIVPQTNEDEFKGEALKNNIFAQRVMILENDQQSVRELYMGLTFEYRGNRETLNLTKEIEGRLEYEITGIIRRLAQTKLPQVSVYQDSLYSPNYYETFEHHMNQNYQVMPVNLTEPLMMSQVLFFPGVIDSLSKIQMYNLDQYIMHGGRVIFMQDRAVGLVQMNSAQEIQSNIFDLLKHYGIDIQPNIVMDQNCAPISVKQRSGIFVVDVPVPFPPIPLIQGNKDSIISKGLSDIVIYMASQIVTPSANKDVQLTPILRTSQNSGLLKGPEYDLSPEKFIGQNLMATLTHPPITIAALANGTFTSYFANDPAAQKTTGFVAKTDKAEIFVLSDSDFIREFIASLSSTNMMLMLNVIDFMLKDTSMVEVRSRNLPDSPMEVGYWLYKMGVKPDRIAGIEPNVKRIIKGINLLLPSLLLILFGVWRFFRIKQRKLALRQRYQLMHTLPANDPPVEIGIADDSDAPASTPPDEEV